jgi:hypothetical protein
MTRSTLLDGPRDAVLGADEGPQRAGRREVAQRVKDEAARFHRASLAVRIPYRDRLRYWLYHLALAHRGVMVHSPTHDAQYEDGFLKRGYDKYCEKINRRLTRRGPQSSFVEAPAFAHGELGPHDLEWLLKRNIPFVIRGGARGLPVMEWTLDSLEQAAGACSVPINEAADLPSPDLSRPTKAHHYYEFRTGTLAEVAASIRRGGKARISTAEDVMHHDHGRLRRDLDLAHWERMSGWEQNQRHWLRGRMLVGKVVGAQLMMQPENAFTIWHAEPGGNFFVLSKGVKTWTLAHPYYTAAMRPRVKRTTNYYGCNIDVREPDETQRQRGFEGYLAIPKVRVHMEPGDVLRVPNHWWHTAVTHPGHYALAATIRTECMPNLVGPGYMILRWFDDQFRTMAQAYAKEGRIADRHIGYPRRSRSAG